MLAIKHSDKEQVERIVQAHLKHLNPLVNSGIEVDVV